jgi:hypothetical protein
MRFLHFQNFIHLHLESANTSLDWDWDWNMRIADVGQTIYFNEQSWNSFHDVSHYAWQKNSILTIDIFVDISSIIRKWRLLVFDSWSQLCHDGLSMSEW